jgi:hypothetical protein
MLRLNAQGFDNDVLKLKNFRRPECEFWSAYYELNG